MRVLITTSDYPSYKLHFDALAAGNPHCWADAEFHYEPDGLPFDAWVVWQSNHGLPGSMTVECPPSRTLLVLREPPDIVTLPLAYTRQFGGILGPDGSYHHPHTFYEQFGQVWHVEKDADFLKACAPPPEKKGWISAVTSNKAGTVGQKARLRLLEDLKSHFKDKIDHYGRGIRHTDSKWDAVFDYRYHLTLENGLWPHYWSEKLSDAYLGWSVPLYAGCPNIADYFDRESMLALDINNTRDCIKKIEEAMDSGLYERLIPAIGKAREKILQVYHFYPTILRSLQRMPISPRVDVTLRAREDFDFSRGQMTKMRLRNFKAWIMRMP